MEGIRDAIIKIAKETETNNSRKYKGLPLKRKHHKKDNRNQIRRDVQKLQRIKELIKVEEESK